ncbi:MULTISPECIES: dihydropteroate synthase [unclassified Oleiphilus]|nr:MULTISPECIES: dihydropteroate synthase [unclassified Oleiphilus]KZY46261.1 dihydropteroate synthase [Oleiphilus sp. HI0050]KZY76031.1 dihydropteroate synthase [Oleiphilus sp. HI0068]KZY77007.1 dihydropteroate synthase [Oleiphilus sp. HI0069]KZY92817.1 dihydropteroate synthase [Oleiphilus sp. HI0072]KZZ19658.1 dihydropteroate synthase [Oleiphilus sp. HI0081]KZZ20312.1 dihydropteroate synthase [Oleiphilus sp. HI0078]KZZ31024.1 dihydropteroate synthase [Oleiphilus sp. HI0085]
MSQLFKFASRELDLATTQVMGVLNVTPDSFSDGGQYSNLDSALNQVEIMLAQGASIIDVGGESTRPGAQPVSVQEELDRVCPVAEKILQNFDVVLSVDTSTPQVMRETVALGAGLINDVRAFTRPGAVEAVAGANVALCVMHMQGKPDTMQIQPEYTSVVEEVEAFLLSRINTLKSAGVDDQRLIVDPGFGFGKTLSHNLSLLAGIERLKRMGYPVLVGVSRKSMFADLLGRDVEQRLAGSLSAATLAAWQGAEIVRVHDVVETVDAVRVVDAVKRAG